MNVRGATWLVRTGGIALVVVALVAAVHPHMGLLGYDRWLVLPVALGLVVLALRVRGGLPAAWRRPWVPWVTATGAAVVCC